MNATSNESGVGRIAAERVRQIADKGWTEQHDRDEHADGSLTDAAAALLLEYDGAPEVEDVLDRAKPWVRDLHAHANAKYRGQDRYRLLEIAGAFIAAELDRISGAP